MNFDHYLTERAVDDAHEAMHHVGIKLQKDHDTNEHSALVPKDHEGSLKVAKLHLHLQSKGWKHKEHPSGHVFTHRTKNATVTIYHKGHGPDGDGHHEIVLGQK